MLDLAFYPFILTRQATAKHFASFFWKSSTKTRQWNTDWSITQNKPKWVQIRNVVYRLGPCDFGILLFCDSHDYWVRRLYSCWFICRYRFSINKTDRKYFYFNHNIYVQRILNIMRPLVYMYRLCKFNGNDLLTAYTRGRILQQHKRKPTSRMRGLAWCQRGLIKRKYHICIYKICIRTL